MTRHIAATTVGLLAFLIYYSTLLPGFDLGDTPSFQVMGGMPSITPRDGYPLYFGIGRLFTWGHSDPAHALNLASAAAAAVACAVIVLVALEISGSLAAGVASALFVAGSYTFWSQAVIAEVYALHVCLIGTTLFLLLRWERQPGAWRLSCFLAAYALSFSHHLTMVLLGPAYAVFVLRRAPGGWRFVLNRRVLLSSAGFTVLGAVPYLWNFRALWLVPMPPEHVRDAVEAFWFDVTKADWRDTMVGSVPADMAVERLRMYAFDLCQQFGVIVPIIAVVGAVRLFRTRVDHAWLFLGVYVVTLLFALTYNVGDSHVFFLPPHLALALLTAPGIVAIGRLARRSNVAIPVVAMVAIAVAATRIYSEYPALDRSDDTRPATLLSTLTSGLDDQRAIFLSDLNWEVQNGLTYFTRRARNDLAAARMPDVLLYAPALIRDNRAAGRETVLSERAARSLSAAYGPLYRIDRDPRVRTPTLLEVTQTVPRRTRYVLTVLRPTRDMTIDDQDLTAAVKALSGGRTSGVPEAEFVVMAGLMSELPDLTVHADQPFRRRVSLGGLPVAVRMDAWLAFDTIRRMGFGHVIANRHHTLIVERGISFVAFNDDGSPIVRGYFREQLRGATQVRGSLGPFSEGTSRSCLS